MIQYYKIDKIEQIFAFLILIMAVCFFIALTKCNPEVPEILRGIFLPTIPENSMSSMIGLIGCIIMPHNLYLHSSLVQSRKINRSNPYSLKLAIKYFNLESFAILLVSFFINAFVISTFATFSLQDKDLTIQNAGDILNQQFKYGSIIWGLGLLAAGQSSTLAGTMAGQFVMEGFIKIKMSRTKRQLLTRCFAMVPSMMVALIGNPETLNSSLNVLQAIQLPFALIPLLKLAHSE